MRSLARLALFLAAALLPAVAPARPMPARADPRRAAFWAHTTGSRPVILGSAAFDTIRSAAGERTRLLGGSALYAAAAAAIGGLSRPIVRAPIGDDFSAADRAAVRALGIDDRELTHRHGRSFSWTGEYLPNGKDRVTVEAQTGVLPGFRPRAPAGPPPRYVLLGNLAPAQQLQLLRALPERPRFVIADSMNHYIKQHARALAQLLPQVDLLTLNDEEAALLAGTNNLRAAATAILAMGPRWVIVKRGGAGATLYRSERGRVHARAVPAYPVAAAIDPTGAGDSFAGALLAYLAHVDRTLAVDLERGLRYASAIASRTVEAFGTEGLRTLDRVEVARRFDVLAGQRFLPSARRQRAPRTRTE
jgi:sugar/nucleoside kinase (ribokinase family)